MIMAQLIMLFKMPERSMGKIVKWKRPFLNKKCSLLNHRSVVEVDLATLWVMEKTLEVVR